MQKLLAAMERLTSAAGIAEGGRLGKELDPLIELREFDEQIEQLRKTHAQDDRPALPQTDFDEIWQRWIRVRPDLSTFNHREVRALCWDTRAAADERFVRSLVTSNYIPRVISMLRGLWHSHQEAWRLDTARQIEKQIKIAATSPGYHPSWLKAVGRTQDMLSHKGPIVLEQLLGNTWDVESVFRPFGVTPKGKLGQRVIDAAIERWLHEVEKRSLVNGACTIVREGYTALTPQELIDDDRFRKVVRQLLLQIPKGSEEYRSTVTALILSDERLGHPKRFTTRSNWIYFTEDIIRIAVHLFAARDLGAFFEILMERGDDEQKRHMFWRSYIESRQLTNFAIACDDEGIDRLKARGTRERTSASRLIGAPPHHSAFIMQFKGKTDITLVEMSKGGNALYLFLSKDFEQHVGSLEDDEFRFCSLKNRGLMLDRWTHRGPWHEKFAEDLAAQFGIHRSRGV